MDEELILISEEIFQNIIAKLTLHLRFMDIALNRYTFAGDSINFRCDGSVFHYSPIAVIKMYRNDPDSLTRGYLHVVFHSIFLHEHFAEERKISLWNLACDIAVENVIMGLHLHFLERDADEEKKKWIGRIQEKISVLSAPRIYHVLEDMDSDEIRLMAPLFSFDDHDRWYHVRNVTGSHDTLFGDETKDDSSAEGNNRFDKASHDTGEKKEGEDPNASDTEIQQVRNTLKDWKEISEKIETDLETFSKEFGDEAQALVQSLKELHREKYSYTQFLKKFMITGEKLQINDNEFDTIFYTYGLRLYHNLPLIEPLEFSEVNNVRELVIAIDTSGSVQGDTVQAFLQKTYNIFQERENFFSRFRIHILQCDMQIRDAAVITAPAQFDDYIRNLEIKGLGGTDFRPVFEYVNEQIRLKQFRKLGGLLYFTDGDGIYPKTKPSFLTAFLFLEGNKDITVPPWAIRYILEREDIYAYQSGQSTD